jgi:hypothetical protein
LCSGITVLQQCIKGRTKKEAKLLVAAKREVRSRSGYLENRKKNYYCKLWEARLETQHFDELKIPGSKSNGKKESMDHYGHCPDWRFV